MIFLEFPTITPHGHWSYLSKKFLHEIASELRLYAYTNAHKSIRIYVQELTIAVLKSDFLSTLGRWNSRRRIRTAVSMDMSHVRFRFSILLCTCLEEPFQRVHLLTTRGSHYITDKQYVFGTRLYIPTHCSVLFLPPNFQSPNSKWEKMELNHPSRNGNCFTGSPATSTVYSPKTRKNRVSNRFIVLCFPLSTSFSAVDSLDIFMRLSWVVPFKNSLFQRALH